jgi:hypothetical protein
MFLLALTLITKETQDQNVLFEKEMERKSICFIMGEDKGDHRYYELAEQHFLFDQDEKTDVLVKTCRSIEDIIRFLNINNSNGQLPWGTIQIVVHGNTWSGLSLSLEEAGPRATPKELVKILVENPLTRLQINRIDSTTKINLWGCGIGKNPIINLAMDSLFTDVAGVKPDIYTSPHYVIFQEGLDNTAPKRIKASYWPYFFKRGYRPSDWTIAKAYEQQFPEAKVDWRQALSNDENKEGKPFQNSFHVPISWTLIYDEENERPKLRSQEEKIKWVKDQEDIMEQVDLLGIPFDDFHWTVNRIRFKEDGKDLPAIKAIGMSTVVCVLKEI